MNDPQVSVEGAARKYADDLHTLNCHARVWQFARRDYLAGHTHGAASRDREVAKLREQASESGAARFYDYWMESASECKKLIAEREELKRERDSSREHTKLHKTPWCDPDLDVQTLKAQMQELVTAAETMTTYLLNTYGNDMNFRVTCGIQEESLYTKWLGLTGALKRVKGGSK